MFDPFYQWGLCFANLCKSLCLFNSISLHDNYNINYWSAVIIVYRLGITAPSQQDPDDEVNEFLGSSIEARSIDKCVCILTPHTK